MRKLKEHFHRKHGIVSRIFSMVLALAMIVTMVPAIGGATTAYAASPTIRLYLDKPSTWSNPVVNVWAPGATVDNHDAGNANISQWGDGGKEKPKLAYEESSRLYYVDVQSSEWTGFQFVDAGSTETAAPEIKTEGAAIEQIKTFTSDTSIYCLLDDNGRYQWYKDASKKETLIPESVPTECDLTINYKSTLGDDVAAYIYHETNEPAGKWPGQTMTATEGHEGWYTMHLTLDNSTDYTLILNNDGQGKELEGLEERAKLSGAAKLYIEDIVDDFADNYIVPCVQAHAVYEDEYLLGTSMARPVIAKKLVEIARKEGASAICHGATGKGNDQIRFELAIKALAPDLKIIAPWRMTDVWTMQSRDDEIEYCKKHGIDLPFDHSHSYSRDRNLWHISHEGLELEDPANEPNYDHMLVLGVTPEKAPDQDEYVTMTFEKGVPTSVNGKKMKVADIIRELNKLGGKHGIGIVDIVENRVVGMKSRGVYETPGGTILMEAHKQLEELVLDRATMEAKKDMGNKLSQVVYEGKWFTPLCDAIRAFVASTQEYVTGEVKFKLYKGNIIKAGTTSPYSLYNESLASFTTGDMYDHHDASGFITLFGLPLKVRAMKLMEAKENQK